MTKVLFINSGILGMASFSKFIREAMVNDPEIDASHIDLSENLRLDERIIRRLLCTRLWRDGLLGLKNVDLERLRSDYHAGFQASRRIRKALAKGRVDVLHFHRQATACASLSLMGRVPSIVSIDATQDIMIDAATSSIERFSYQPNAAMDGRVFRTAAAIVSTSNWAADCLRRRYPNCEAPVHVMPTPVRLQLFDPGWIDERFARAEATGYPPKVVFIGDDFIRKGGPDLLDAWREGRLHESATLDIVTNWPVPLSELPGVRIRHAVAAYSPGWFDVWKSADVFVLPTRQDAFATVFQEAAAAGLPRIGTRVNAVPETIHDGESGLLVTVGNRAELVRSLQRLIASAALRRQLGTAGRHAIEGFGPDAYLSKLREVVQSIAPRSR